MTVEQSNPDNNSAAKGDPKKLSYAIVVTICAFAIGLLVWIADPNAPLESNAQDSYYNRLVEGFRAGQLNLKMEVPPELAKLANPYSPNVNRAYLKDVSDLSYYKGKLYLYFGIVPALLLFWPYLILTGHYLSDRGAVIFFFIMGFLIAAGLLRDLWRRYFSGASIWLAAVGLVAMGLSIALTLYGNVYEVPVISGFAFTMLALAAIWYAWHEPKRRVLWLLLASLAYGLAVGSRPSLLFGGIILLVPAAQAWCGKKNPGQFREGALLLAAAAGPITLIVFGLMLYNALRFDNPFEFGWHYQVHNDVESTTTRQFSLHYLWFNFRYYFLEPIRWDGHFPFVQTVLLPPVPSGHDVAVADPYGSISSNYPLILMVLAVPFIWRQQPEEAISILRWFLGSVCLLFMSCALMVCLFFNNSSRYELDFLPALLLLAIIGFLCLERELANLPGWRRIARGGWCLLLAYSIVFNVLVSIEAHADTDQLVGNIFFSQGDLDEAMIQYQKALALWPECADARCGLGSVLFKKGHANEAILEFQKALEIKPDFAVVYSNLGFSFLQVGRVDDAISQYERAVELRPESATFRNGLGNALFLKGRIGEAIIQYQKTLELKPDFIETYSHLAYCLLQLGRVDDAIIQYQRAIELRPESAADHNALGSAFFQKGQTDQAIIQFQKALTIKPDFAEAHFNLGYCFFLTGRLDDAIVQYRTTIELRPNLAQAYKNLGDTFRKKGMTAEAKASYQKALELQPAVGNQVNPPGSR